MQSLQHILIIRGGAIGDFILTMPVLAALRSQNVLGGTRCEAGVRHTASQTFSSASRIELLSNPSIASLATKFSLADNIRDLNSQSFTPLFTRDGNCDPNIAQWLSSFDLIISYLHDPDKIFETNIRRFSKAQFITGPHRPNEQSTAHASQQLLEPVASLIRSPSRPLDVRARGEDALYPSFNVQSSMFNVQCSFSNKIAIHPGSGSVQKNWPEEKWRSFLEHLVATTDDKILLIGGEAENNRLPSLAELIAPHRREVALRRPLVELVDLLKDCRIFIGHDSGITHLAAVLGLECIVLWGPTNERIWRPLGNRVQILRHPQTLRDLPVKTVTEALNSLLTTS